MDSSEHRPVQYSMLLLRHAIKFPLLLLSDKKLIFVTLIKACLDCELLTQENVLTPSSSSQVLCIFQIFAPKRIDQIKSCFTLFVDSL